MSSFQFWMIKRGINHEPGGERKEKEMKFRFSYEKKTAEGRRWFDRVIEADSVGDAAREARRFANENALTMRGVARVND